ncbi:glycosyltransferase [Candidatus Parcubacteria bacterium]|nr:MAG: glycosyltransferase [Candidatus Parcubacteria bacterium]
MTLDPVTGGGSAERTLQISRALNRAGHQCTILTTDTGLSPAYLQQCKKWGLSVVALPSLWRRFYLPKPSQHLIKKLVAGADVVNLMSHWTLINALVYRAVKKLAKRYTVCPAGALPIFGRSKVLKKLYNHLIGREIILHANGCIAISPNEIKHFKSYGVQPDKVSVIPNGINPADYPESDGKKFRTRHGIGDAPMILFMGRLNIIKGPDMLLDAFCRCSQDKRMKTYHLVFAGPDGGMLNELRRMVETSGVKNRIHFTGHIGGSEKSEAYRAADFLAIPSRQEAMSIVVLEAGVTGTPVLLTDQCGFDDVAAVAGGMVVAASIEGLQKGLLSMTSDPEKLEIMGQNLREFTREHFLWDNMVNSYLELFSRIMH